MRGPVALRSVLPAAVVAVAAAYLVFALAGPSDPRAPVDVHAAGERFDDARDLAAAADEVVEAVVGSIDDGRTITDPDRPDTGISTQLVRLDVVGTGRAITIEQELSLLDGTPITVNGLAALEVGDHGVAFLVRGSGDEFPYSVLVNEQSWLEVVDGELAPGDAVGEIGDAWSGRPPEDLLASVVGQTG